MLHCANTCTVTRTRGPPPWWCAAPRRPSSTQTPRSTGAHLRSEAAAMAPTSCCAPRSSCRSCPAPPPRPPAPPTSWPASAPRTSTLLSCRTPIPGPRSSTWPRQDSARTANRKRCSPTASPRSAAGCPSTPTVACWPTANRSARPAFARSTSWSSNCAAPQETVKYPTIRGSGWPSCMGHPEPQPSRSCPGSRQPKGVMPMTDTQAESRPRAEVDLDHHSPAFREDPYRRFRQMRESGCPVAHSGHYEGFWALVDYPSVFEASRDDDLFNSFPSAGVPASELPLPILPIESDPPETQEVREVTQIGRA